MALINSMLSDDPINRPTLPEIMEHVWFTGEPDVGPDFAASEEVAEMMSSVIAARDQTLESKADVYEDIMNTLAEEMAEGDDRDFGEKDPQEISLDEVNRTSVVSQFSPE